MKGEIIEQHYGKMVEEGHLGGFLDGGDAGTYYPVLWEYIIDKYAVKSVIDIGCGRGYSARYFQSLGCDILGIDGSVAAKDLSLIPESFKLHDYTTGTTGIDRKFDLAWSCEFLEHVEEQYMENYMRDFALAKYSALTFAAPNQWGHHHVNCQPQEYWIDNFQKRGFEYMEEETNYMRSLGILHFKERGLFFKHHE